ncbi:hypothetical protein T03_2182 [Trichinella britovi]|uniref:Uncharacterized protein n=1 Tax=Trichinella britovi TaxID=45882 RepID=A0A0V1CLU7_TRIBR|nr:hypothetical protein T03_2182 [Trichinella britovi]
MSNCFKRDVTKLQTMKLKIDRMRRKKNPLGWALPQQSNEGLIQFDCMKARNSADLNAVPLSVTRQSGRPCVANNSLKASMAATDDVDGTMRTSSHLENASTTKRKILPPIGPKKSA